ncbi:MAG: dimethylsulfoniopropionate demethylase [Gammaproteobacteria bacterium]|nr:dimethylsulfoniopropionate demethylase [Gammaproteobacteria bacterium]MDH3465397.1 dimethylsulfoniopropionate demethylase [Gammaproteobacteria bacterium]
MPTSGLNVSRRIRRTPYTDQVEAHGVRGFSVVNHMLLPKAYQRSLQDDYWHLREHVQLWDVSCQRQVELRGKHAARLAQWMTPRDLRRAEVGQCLYVAIVDENGGMINDPLLLKLAEDRFWFSIADSDVLLWAKGLALGAGMEVEVSEPDVSVLAVQGPKAEDLMANVFGPGIRDVKFFRFAEFEFQGTRQLIARSGYSKQGGFEIYLNDGSLGSALWDTLWKAGQPFDVAPGCPNLIERVEGGLLSYGNEMTRENNPLECAMDDYCTLDGSIDFIGRTALQSLQRDGVQRLIRGVWIDGAPCPPCATPWPVVHNGVGDRQIGQITTAIYSPRFECNIGLSMIERGFWEPGQPVTVHSADGDRRGGTVTSLPFASPG